MYVGVIVDIIKKNTEKTGIIIVGANKCAELRRYRNRFFKPIVAFEPIPEIYEELKNKKGVLAHNMAVSDYVGETDFYVMDNSVSSSMLRPKDVIKLQKTNVSKIIKVPVTTLDVVIGDPSQFGALIIDAEGSEMNILLGAEELLKHIPVICTELNYKENYEGCKNGAVVKDFLNKRGFKLKLERYCDQTKAYTDAIFIRR